MFSFFCKSLEMRKGLVTAGLLALTDVLREKSLFFEDTITTLNIPLL